MDEIVPIKVKLPGTSNNIKLYVLSDVHIGEANMDILTFPIVQAIFETPLYILLNHFPLEPAGMWDFPARYVNIYYRQTIIFNL